MNSRVSYKQSPIQPRQKAIILKTPGSVLPSHSWKTPGLGILPDALLPMESHKIEGQVLEAVSPLIVFVQLLFQPPQSELC